MVNVYRSSSWWSGKQYSPYHLRKLIEGIKKSHGYIDDIQRIAEEKEKIEREQAEAELESMLREDE